MDNQGQQLLVQCLAGLLNVDSGVRGAAEKCFRQLEGTPGFAQCLSSLLPSNSTPSLERHLAAIHLKNTLRNVWASGLSASEMAAVRRNVLSALSADVPESKLRTAFAMVLSSILAWDFPARWPDGLFVVVANLRNPCQNSMKTALRTLELFVSGDNFSSPSAFSVMDQMIPELLRIFLSVDYDFCTRERALKVFFSCIQWLAFQNDLPEKNLDVFFSSVIPSWLSTFFSFLSSPFDSKMTDISIRTVIFDTLILLFTYFTKYMQGYGQMFLQKLWDCLSAIDKIYRDMVIVDEAPLFDPDEEGNAPSIARFVCSVLECFITIFSRKCFRPLLGPFVENVVNATISLMQITIEQEGTWSQDCDAYVQDEDPESFASNVRVSGTDLIKHIGKVFNSPENINYLFMIMVSRYAHADTLKEKNDPHWWRLKEASLCAMSALASEIVDTAQQNTNKHVTEQMTLTNATLSALLRSFLANEFCGLGTPGSPRTLAGYPFSQSIFLLGKMLVCASQLGRNLPIDELMPFFRISCEILVPNRDFVSVVNSCRALLAFSKYLRGPCMESFISALIPNLCCIVPASASEDTIFLLLDTLSAAIDISSNAVVKIEPTLTSCLFGVWGRHSTDSLIADSVLGILEKVANIPVCYGSIFSKFISIFVRIMSDPEQFKGLVVSSLRILEFFIGKNITDPTSFKVPENINLGTLFNVLVNFVCNQRAEDIDIIEMGLKTLRFMMIVFSEQIPGWRKNFGSEIIPFCVAILQSEDDSVMPFATAFICNFIRDFFMRFSHMIVGIAPGLLRQLFAIFRALGDQTDALFVLHILTLVCCSSPAWLVNFLAEVNGLEYFINKWMSSLEDLKKIGNVYNKQSTMALMKLFTLRDPRIEGMTCIFRGQKVRLCHLIMSFICNEYNACDWETLMDNPDSIDVGFDGIDMDKMAKEYGDEDEFLDDLDDDVFDDDEEDSDEYMFLLRNDKILNTDIKRFLEESCGHFLMNTAVVNGCTNSDFIINLFAGMTDKEQETMKLIISRRPM